MTRDEALKIVMDTRRNSGVSTTADELLVDTLVALGALKVDEPTAQTLGPPPVIDHDITHPVSTDDITTPPTVSGA